MRISRPADSGSSFRLSVSYFVLFSVLGAYLPFWAPYLRSLGFSPAEIGELLAVVLLTRIVAPYIWGRFADRSGLVIGIIRLGIGMSCVFSALLTYYQDYFWMAVILFLFSFFYHAILPLLEAVTMSFLGKKKERYSTIRVWGSVGFIVCSLALAPLFQYYGLQLLPWVISILLLLLFATSFLVSEKPVVISRETQLKQFRLWQPKIICLLALTALMQFSHGPYYAFFSIYLADNGYGEILIGVLWALGVLAEIVIFMFMPRLLPRFGATTLLLTSFVAASLRWLIIGFFPQFLSALVVAQLLHAATYGLYHAAALRLVHQFFPESLTGRGHALYSSTSFGIGGSLGLFLSGVAWESLGSTLIFSLAALTTLLGAFVSTQLRRWEE